MNIADSTAARSSATIMEIQIPSTSNTSGRSITAAIWNTSVLKNDISAETSPLLSAVKKDEPNIAIPENRNENDAKRKALTVKDRRFSS